MELAIIGGIAFLGYMYKESKVRTVDCESSEVINNDNTPDDLDYDILDNKNITVKSDRPKGIERFTDEDIPASVHPDSIARKFYTERSILNYSEDYKQTKLDLYTGNAGSVYAKPAKKETGAIFKPIESASLITQSGRPASSLGYLDDSRYWVRENLDFNSPTKDKVIDLPLSYAEIEIKQPNTSTKRPAELPHPMTGRSVVPKPADKGNLGISTNSRILEKGTGAIPDGMVTATNSVVGKAMTVSSSQARIPKNIVMEDSSRVAVPGRGIGSDVQANLITEHIMSAVEKHGVSNMEVNSSNAGMPVNGNSTGPQSYTMGNNTRRVDSHQDRNKVHLYTSLINPGASKETYQDLSTSRAPKAKNHARGPELTNVLHENVLKLPDGKRNDSPTISEGFASLDTRRKKLPVSDESYMSRTIHNNPVKAIPMPVHDTLNRIKENTNDTEPIPRVFTHASSNHYQNIHGSAAREMHNATTANQDMFQVGRTMPTTIDSRSLFEHDAKFNTNMKSPVQSGSIMDVTRGNISTMPGMDYRLSSGVVDYTARNTNKHHDVDNEKEAMQAGQRTMTIDPDQSRHVPISTRNGPSSRNIASQEAFIDYPETSLNMGTKPPDLGSVKLPLSNIDVITTNGSTAMLNARIQSGSQHVDSSLHVGTNDGVSKSVTHAAQLDHTGLATMPTSGTLKYPEVSGSSRQEYDESVIDRQYPVNTGSSLFVPISTDNLGQMTTSRQGTHTPDMTSINLSSATTRAAIPIMDATRPRQDTSCLNSAGSLHSSVTKPLSTVLLAHDHTGEITRYTDRGVASQNTSGPMAPVVMRVPAATDEYMDSVRVPERPTIGSFPGPNNIHPQVVSVVDSIEEKATRPTMTISKGSNNVSQFGGHAVFNNLRVKNEGLDGTLTRDRKIGEVPSRQFDKIVDKATVHPLSQPYDVSSL